MARCRKKAGKLLTKSKWPNLGKPRNADRRGREHLTPEEIDRVIAAAGKVGRYGHRDATMILMAYRHGLRVSELISLRWDQVDLKTAQLHVRRRKNGLPSTHPLCGPQLRALRRLRREYGDTRYVFMSERKAPMTSSTFHRILARAGRLAEIEMPLHPHMLRHSTGFKLANEGHDTRAIQQYLGHRSIQHTVRYTELTPSRFDGFWDD